MKQVRVINQTRQATLATEAQLADNAWTRLRGLLGRRSLEPGQGLVIRPSNGIHTFFMAFPIDAIYVDAEGRVLRCLANLRPYRFGPIDLRCKMIIELPEGTIERSRTEMGDRIELR
jgi:uncharacterized membrane protein (UPF0127 family)